MCVWVRVCVRVLLLISSTIFSTQRYFCFGYSVAHHLLPLGYSVAHHCVPFGYSVAHHLLPVGGELPVERACGAARGGELHPRQLRPAPGVQHQQGGVVGAGLAGEQGM